MTVYETIVVLLPLRKKKKNGEITNYKLNKNYQHTYINIYKQKVQKIIMQEDTCTTCFIFHSQNWLPI